MREALRQYKSQTTTDQDDERWIAEIIAQVQANPMTSEEVEAEFKRAAVYGARQAKKLGIKESDAVRIVHESRARRAG